MVLRNKNIVVGTKNGNRVIYSLRDPLIIDLLQVAKQIFNNHLVDTISMLDKMNVQDEESEAERRNNIKTGLSGISPINPVLLFIILFIRKHIKESTNTTFTF